MSFSKDSVNPVLSHALIHTIEARLPQGVCCKGGEKTNVQFTWLLSSLDMIHLIGPNLVTWPHLDVRRVEKSCPWLDSQVPSLNPRSSVIKRKTANHILDERPVSKKLLTLNKSFLIVSKMSNPSGKWPKDMNRHFTEENI